MTSQPSFREALRFWLTLGFISFGGPAGQIAIMQTELVDRRGWIDQAAFLRALNFCMLLPGPEAQQLATYIGWKLHGVRGALTAGILFVLPGALLLYGLAWVAAEHGDTALVAAILTGLKPIVVALVLHAIWRLGRRTLTSGFSFSLAVGAFVALEYIGLPFPVVIFGAGAIGWLNARRKAAEADSPAPPIREGTEEPWVHVLAVAAAYGVLLLAPVGLLLLIVGTDPFLLLARFFTQAAFVTFGGAYAVLPYVADAAVNNFHWLSPAEMINGLALAETTPGPLILVLQYVGFFAGWNSGVLTPLAAATVGAVLTTYVTFLPSIMFILAGAPYIERIARVKVLAGALAAIGAAVVGVIGTLAMLLGRAVVFITPTTIDWPAVAAIIVALILLIRLRLQMHWAVLAGAAFGLARATLGF